jgi:hypothetical protein
MTFLDDSPGLERRYSLHRRAASRHAAWARDFAAVGDHEEARLELLDITAIAAELRDDAVVSRDD